MGLAIAYVDAQSRDLAAVVTDTATGKVWSPAAAGFAAAGAADELLPLARLTGSPNLASMSVGWFPALPNPPADDQWVVTVHPKAGGAPLGAPIPLRVPGAAPAAPPVLVVAVAGTSFGATH